MKDAASVWDLHSTAADSANVDARDSYFRDLKGIEEHFLVSGGEFLIAKMRREIVGMGGMLTLDQGEGQIKSMRVHPQYQRMGIGSAILSKLEEKAKLRGIERLRLDTLETQFEARRFYEKS